MSALEKIKEHIRRLLSLKPGLRERKRLQLTYVAVKRLRERGEQVTVSKVVEEARRVMEESRGEIEWGFGPEEYTEEVAAPLLQELLDMGVVDPDPVLLEELDKRLRRGGGEGDEEGPVKDVMLFTRPV